MRSPTETSYPTRAQVEARFRLSGAIDRIRKAAETRLHSASAARSAQTRLATQRLIAANPDADARTLISKLPTSVLPVVETAIRDDVNNITASENSSWLQDMFRTEFGRAIQSERKQSSVAAAVNTPEIVPSAMAPPPAVSEFAMNAKHTGVAIPTTTAASHVPFTPRSASTLGNPAGGRSQYAASAPSKHSVQALLKAIRKSSSRSVRSTHAPRLVANAINSCPLTADLARQNNKSVSQPALEHSPTGQASRNSQQLDKSSVPVSEGRNPMSETAPSFRTSPSAIHDLAAGSNPSAVLPSSDDPLARLATASLHIAQLEATKTCAISRTDIPLGTAQSSKSELPRDEQKPDCSIEQKDKTPFAKLPTPVPNQEPRANEPPKQMLQILSAVCAEVPSPTSSKVDKGTTVVQKKHGRFTPIKLTSENEIHSPVRGAHVKLVQGKMPTHLDVSRSEKEIPSTPVESSARDSTVEVEKSRKESISAANCSEHSVELSRTPVCVSVGGKGNTYKPLPAEKTDLKSDVEQKGDNSASLEARANAYTDTLLAPPNSAYANEGQRNVPHKTSGEYMSLPATCSESYKPSGVGKKLGPVASDLNKSDCSHEKLVNSPAEASGDALNFDKNPSDGSIPAPGTFLAQNRRPIVTCIEGRIDGVSKEVSGIDNAIVGTLKGMQNRESVLSDYEKEKIDDIGALVKASQATKIGSDNATLIVDRKCDMAAKSVSALSVRGDTHEKLAQPCVAVNENTVLQEKGMRLNKSEDGVFPDVPNRNLKPAEGNLTISFVQSQSADNVTLPNIIDQIEKSEQRTNSIVEDNNKRMNSIDHSTTINIETNSTVLLNSCDANVMPALLSQKDARERNEVSNEYGDRSHFQAGERSNCKPVPRKSLLSGKAVSLSRNLGTIDSQAVSGKVCNESCKSDSFIGHRRARGKPVETSDPELGSIVMGEGDSRNQLEISQQEKIQPLSKDEALCDVLKGPASTNIEGDPKRDHMVFVSKVGVEVDRGEKITKAALSSFYAKVDNSSPQVSNVALKRSTTHQGESIDRSGCQTIGDKAIPRKGNRMMIPSASVELLATLAEAGHTQANASNRKEVVSPQNDRAVLEAEKFSDVMFQKTVSRKPDETQRSMLRGPTTSSAAVKIKDASYCSKIPGDLIKVIEVECTVKECPKISANDSHVSSSGEYQPNTQSVMNRSNADEPSFFDKRFLPETPILNLEAPSNASRGKSDAVREAALSIRPSEVNVTQEVHREEAFYSSDNGLDRPHGLVKGKASGSPCRKRTVSELKSDFPAPKHQKINVTSEQVPGETLVAATLAQMAGSMSADTDDVEKLAKRERAARQENRLSLRISGEDDNSDSLESSEDSPSDRVRRIDPPGNKGSPLASQELGITERSRSNTSDDRLPRKVKHSPRGKKRLSPKRKARSSVTHGDTAAESSSESLVRKDLKTSESKAGGQRQTTKRRRTDSKKTSSHTALERESPYKQRKKSSMKSDASSAELFEVTGTRVEGPKDMNDDVGDSTWHVVRDIEKQELLLMSLRKLMESEDSSPFLEPVERTGAFGARYHSIIKNPMDLGTISKRLASSTTQRAFYRDVNAALMDVELVWSNCRTFNPMYDEVTLAANRCSDELNKMLSEIGIISLQRVNKPRRRSMVGTTQRSQSVGNTPEKSGKKKAASVHNTNTKSTKRGSRLVDVEEISPNMYPDNDGRLIGKQIAIFTALNGRVKAWYRVKVMSYDFRSSSYTLKWIDDDNNITTDGTFGLQMKYPVYRA